MAYIYRHIRLDANEPFYIGISKSNTNYKRAFQKTGEVFNCAKDVALIYGWNYKTFLNRLSGNAKNETDFKYL